MEDDLFYDTSVLVYAFDSSDVKKHETCVNMIDEIVSSGRRAFISNQILGELFSVLTESISIPIEKSLASEIINDFVAAKSWVKFNYTYNTVRNAAKASDEYRMPFWDSLIVETMKENGINAIVTENVKHFKRANGIKIVNPFEK